MPVILYLAGLGSKFDLVAQKVRFDFAFPIDVPLKYTDLGAFSAVRAPDSAKMGKNRALEEGTCHPVPVSDDWEQPGLQKTIHCAGKMHNQCVGKMHNNFLLLKTIPHPAPLTCCA